MKKKEVVQSDEIAKGIVKAVGTLLWVFVVGVIIGALVLFLLFYIIPTGFRTITENWILLILFNIVVWGFIIWHIRREREKARKKRKKK